MPISNEKTADETVNKDSEVSSNGQADTNTSGEGAATNGDDEFKNDSGTAGDDAGDDEEDEEDDNA